MKDLDKKQFFHGTFKVVDGELDFVCHTKGVSFEEVRVGITKLRDELNRQIENQSKCPFHKEN